MTIREHVSTVVNELGYPDLDYTKFLNKQMDSIDLTAMVVTLEEELSISISDEDRYACKTMNDFIYMIETKVFMNKYDLPNDYRKKTIDEQITWMNRLHFESDDDQQMVRDIKENLIAIRLIQAKP
jgi:acyl carrier protein